MKKFFLLLSFLSVLVMTEGQKQKLEFNLSVGQTYYHVMNSTSTIEEEVSNQKMTIGATITGKIAFKVTGKKDTVYEMDVTYQELSMTMKAPNGSATFSSGKKDPNDIFSSVLAALTEKPFQLEMSRSGKIVDVKNLDSNFDRALQHYSNLSAAQKQQIKAQMMQSFGKKAFKGSFEMTTAIYPNKPVAKGDSWTSSTNLSSGVLATLVTTYEYKDKTSGYNLITGKGVIATSDKSGYTEVNSMPTKYSLKGTMVSTLKTDSKTGWIIESKINETMSGRAMIKDNPKTPGGLVIPMSIVTDISFGSH